MLLYYLLRQPESKASPFDLGRVVGLEELRVDLFFYPMPIVGDRNVNLSRPCAETKVQHRSLFRQGIERIQD